jgi:hypothetical protein
MPEALRKQYKNIKAEAKGPTCQFSGLLGLTLFKAFAIYSDGKDKENTQLYLSVPAVENISEYKADNDSYSTMRVEKLL